MHKRVACPSFFLLTLLLTLLVGQQQVLGQPVSNLPSQPVVPVSKVWVADNGDGTYKNPIIHADYSDPDVCRVGDDFYMVASSFNFIPGLPILHSNDLVNWTIIGHALDRQPPLAHFEKVQHGNGVWAPSIRFHKGEFYIYYGDPDFGIYMIKTKNPAGRWEPPILVQEGKGLIDTCPFWDEDGQAYLVHGWAGSRAGIKSILTLHRMNAAGTQLLDEGVLVFDGHDHHETVEGPKMYKRNGYYYIMAPAGGVATGWQLVLRSKNIYGPYEEKVVLDQGATKINGPHQGAWVELKSGESWFFHFQDVDAYGRIIHLQPVKWVNNWPVMGIDQDGDGRGEPVLTYKKPNVGKTYPLATPQESDEFNTNQLGLQWQWHANPKVTWLSLAGKLGFLRLFSARLPDDFKNYWDVPNLLMQKFPAPAFTATTKFKFSPSSRIFDERAGLIVMGMDYGSISLTNRKEGIYLSQQVCLKADQGEAEKENAGMLIKEKEVWFRVKVDTGAVCRFSYSTDGTSFKEFGEPFTARPGRWVGATLGLFCTRTTQINDSGFADFDWFRIDK